MTNLQKSNLLWFILRPAMYVAHLERNAIVGFIVGFEIGINCNDFTAKLRERLTDTYKIKNSSSGWSSQIKKYSEKKNITWEHAFLSLSLEVIYEFMRLEQLNEFIQFTQKRTINHISGYNYQEPDRVKNWVEYWKTFVDVRQECFLAIWDKEDILNFKRLDKAIKSAYSLSDYVSLINSFTDFYTNMTEKYSHLYSQE